MRDGSFKRSRRRRWREHRLDSVSMILIQRKTCSRRQKPYPQELADAPGLGVAAAGRVGEIAVQNFRDVAEAAGSNQIDAAVEQRPCRGFAFIAIAQHPGFAVGGKLPGPGGAVMVGGFAAGVFVSGIPALIGVEGIVDELAIVPDFKGALQGLVRQASDGAGNQKRLTGLQNRAADIGIADEPQGDGQKLIGP